MVGQASQRSWGQATKWQPRRAFLSPRYYGGFLAASVLCVCSTLPHCLAQQTNSLDREAFRKVTTIAGNGKTGRALQRGPALEIPLSNPFGIQPDANGNLIVASYDQHVVYQLDSSYRRAHIIAGTGMSGLSGKSGDRPTEVLMNQPHEVQIDQRGNILIADTMNHRVGMIAAETGRWVNVAGTGEPGFAGDEGAADEAQINQAYSIVVDDWDLFIADLQNQRIRYVDLQSGIIKTICGNGKKSLPVDGGLAVEQSLAGPRSLAIDDENLWVVLREGNSIWRIDRRDQRIYHVAGTGERGFTGDGGDAKLATFAGPKGITVDPGVAVYIADTENHAIRKIDLANGQISTVMGASGQAGFDGDGDEVAKRKLARPHGVCLLPSGQLLIGDSENHRVRMLER